MPVAIFFDLFGTLLSPQSIAQELEKLYGEERAQSMASLARRYQLEYTWRANSMGVYRPFDELTRFSFRQAAAETGEALSPADEQRIMDAYKTLDAFPDVTEALQLLKANRDAAEPWIFSNGTQDMIRLFLQSIPAGNSKSDNDNDSGGNGPDALFPPKRLVSVDDEALRVYKPNQRTYEYVATVSGFQFTPDKIWLVSSNPFDVVGARVAGMRAAWINRSGGSEGDDNDGWVDGLGGSLGLRPTVVARGVDEAVKAILESD